jgi:hypothetical protein
MAVKYSDGCRKYQLFPFHDTPKFSQIEIFGLKIYHLATLAIYKNHKMDYPVKPFPF